MLAKARRIDRNTFKTLTGRGNVYHSPLLFLSVYPQTNQIPTRFSCLCSKKVSSHAVTRNLLRRRVYAVLQLYIEKIKPGFLCVFSFKKSDHTPTYIEIKESIENLLTQAHII
jgi:ribonuclease P protein component